MFYDGNYNYSKLVCVGRNVPIGQDSGECIPCLCVSPFGRVAIVVETQACSEEATGLFLAKVSSYIDTLRHWMSSDLDSIASDYYYRSCGQAARAWDILACNGFVDFNVTDWSLYQPDSGLQLHDILVIVPERPDGAESRNAGLDLRKIEESDILFSFIEQGVAECVLTRGNPRSHKP